MSLGRKRDFPLPFALTETSGQMGPPSAISGTPRGTTSRSSRAKSGPDAMTKARLHGVMDKEIVPGSPDGDTSAAVWWGDALDARHATVVPSSLRRKPLPPAGKSPRGSDGTAGVDRLDLGARPTTATLPAGVFGDLRGPAAATVRVEGAAGKVGPDGQLPAAAAAALRTAEETERRLRRRIGELRQANSELHLRCLALSAGVPIADGGGGGGGGGDTDKLETDLRRTRRELERAKDKIVAKDAEIDQLRTRVTTLEESSKNPNLIVDAQEQIELIKTLLADDADKTEFCEQVANVPEETKDEWIFHLTTHMKRLGKLMSLNEVITQQVNTMEVAMSAITHEACTLLSAERATVFAIDHRTGELFSVIAGGDDKPAFEIRIPAGIGIAGHVFLSGETVNIPDCYEDPRFNQDVDKKSGLRTKAMVCVPVTAHAGYKMGVLQVMNKTDGGVFSAAEEAKLEGLAVRTGINLLQAYTYEDSVNIQGMVPLLNAALTAFGDEIKVEKAMKLLVDQACDTLDAERCSVFLADTDTKELYTQTADGIIRFPWSKGLAGECFTTGETINIPEPYKDSRFNQANDKRTGFKTSSILCMPIRNPANELIGCVQALNKGAGDDPDLAFTDEDIYYLGRLCTAAGANVQYALLYEAAMSKSDAHKKAKLLKAKLKKKFTAGHDD